MFWNKADVWFFVWQDSAAEDEKENKEEKEEEEKKDEEEVSQIISVMTMYLIIVGYHFAQKKEFITVAEEYEYFNR